VLKLLQLLLLPRSRSRLLLLLHVRHLLLLLERQQVLHIGS
jgi:hypothetical protein